MSSIKEIIRSFVSSSPDDKTKSIFWAWLSSDRDKEEKEQALSEVWKYSPSGSRKDTEKALVKVNRRIFGDADHVLRRRLRYAVAAAVIMPVAILCGAAGLYVLTDKKDMTIAECSTDYGEIEEQLLSDGTSVLVNSGSVLLYPESFPKKGERHVYLTGEAVFTVAKDPGRPFIVHSGDFDVKVLGTVFNLSSYGGDRYSSVIVREGKVQVVPADLDLAPVELGADEMAVLDRQNREMKVFPTSPDIADWTKGDICFSEAGIDAVTQSLERRFGVYISYSSGEEYRNAAITAKFIRGQSLEEILDVLKRLIPGMDYTIIGDHIYLE